MATGPCSRLEDTDGPAGRLENFQRPRNALAVARPQGFSGFRVLLRQDRMQRLGPLLLQPQPNIVAYGGRNRRHVRQAAGQSLEIEPGAADEDRNTPLAAHASRTPTASRNHSPVE